MRQNLPPITMADELRQPTDERMPDDTARVALIERSILVLLVVGLFIGVLAIVKPFTTAILFGAALATAAWPMRQALVRRGLGYGPAAALLLLLSIVIVLLPMLLFAPHLADQMVRARNVCRHISRPHPSSQPGSKPCRSSAGFWAPPGIA